MRTLLALLALLLVACPLRAQTDTVWTRIYKPAANDFSDRLYGGCPTSDGHLVVTGYSDSHTWWNGQQYVMKIDTAGDTLWSAGFGTSQRDYGSDVIETFDQGLAVVGYGRLSSGSEDYKIRLFRTNSLGQQLWEKTFVGSGSCYAHGMIETSDSGLAIAGYDGPAATQDMCLMRTSAVGDSLWLKNYGGAGKDQARDVVQTADGGFILAGYTTSFGAGREDVYLVRTDAVGDTLWTRTYGDTSMDMAYAIIPTSQGDFVVAGYSIFGGATLTQRMFLIRIQANGNTIWTASVYAGESARAYGVCQANDGGFLITGTARYSGNTDMAVAKVSATGDSLWVLTYGGAVSDEGWFVHQYANDDIIAAGTHSWNSSGDYYLMKLRGTPTNIGECGDPALPRDFTLAQNYPNPFNPATVIEFALAEPAHVSIAVFNVRGQRVADLAGGLYVPGRHRIHWNGCSDHGGPVASGVYFYRLTTEQGQIARRMILIR